MDTVVAPAWFMAILLASMLALGSLLLSVLPVMLQLRRRLRLGDVRWPGPPAPPGAAPPDALFPALLRHATMLALTIACLLLLFLGQTPTLAGVLQVDWPWMLPGVTAFLLLAGTLQARQMLRDSRHVRDLLSGGRAAAPPQPPLPAASHPEPGIPHPLLQHPAPGGLRQQALALFVQGSWLLQAGQTHQADRLQQQALELDPFLHQHALQALRRLAQDCDSQESGMLYFWLGAHAEYLWDLKQALSWFQTAADEFHQRGWAERESRARCSLGSVKLRLRDESGRLEFERAVALSPANGAAHLNIARLLYLSGRPGEAAYERALDEFACAIAADPHLYGPMVLASLRKAGDAWKRDLEQVTRRLERKVPPRSGPSLPITQPQRGPR